MIRSVDRRSFLKSAAAGAALIGSGGLVAGPRPALFAAEASAGPEPLFKISLAEWSLHRMLNQNKLDNLDFPAFSKNEFGIDAVEYVNQFFKDKAQDRKYLTELKKRCTDLGVTSVLIMCDGEGDLGDPEEDRRIRAVENHYKWVEAAKLLGCHSIRVNAHSQGSYDEQLKLAADGLRRLSEFSAQHEVGVIVENHGGLSSNGEWLVAVMKSVDHPNCGTLPDFGNFYDYDRYQGVEDLMPYAKGVSAKSNGFDADGNESNIDYRRMMKIVLEAGYRGYVGIEWEGGRIDEVEGIRLTQRLLERVRDEMAASAG